MEAAPDIAVGHSSGLTQESCTRSRLLFWLKASPKGRWSSEQRAARTCGRKIGGDLAVPCGKGSAECTEQHILDVVNIMLDAPWYVRQFGDRNRPT